MLWLAPPLAVFLGGGGCVLENGGKYFPDTALVLEAGIGYRVRDFAFGVHTRISSTHESDADNTIPYVTEWSYTLHTYDVGLAVQYTRGRFTVQPWLGAHLASGTKTTTYNSGPYPPGPLPPDTIEDLDPRPLLTGGVLGAVDIVIRDRHRVALFLDVQTSKSDAERGFGKSYSALTAGVAYRY